MADVPLTLGGSEPTPLDYTVPGAQEIDLVSAFATFDGTGAGGSFLPTLRLLAPSGQIVWEAPVDSSVTAGASVSVSWFPGVGAASSTTPPSTSVVYAYGSGQAGQIIASGTEVAGSFMTTATTTDAGALSWSTGANLNDTLTVNAPGLIIVRAASRWSSTASADSMISISADDQVEHDGQDAYIGRMNNYPIGLPDFGDLAIIHAGGFGNTIQWLHHNGAGFDQSVNRQELSAIWFAGV